MVYDARFERPFSNDQATAPRGRSDRFVASRAFRLNQCQPEPR